MTILTTKNTIPRRNLDFAIKAKHAPYRLSPKPSRHYLQPHQTKPNNHHAHFPPRAMGAASWAIPVGVLGGIVVASFIGVYLWFPRAWQKGVNADTRQVNELQGEEREEQRRKNREVIDRFTKARARERGELVYEDVELGNQQEGVPKHVPPPTYTAVVEGTPQQGAAGR